MVRLFRRWIQRLKYREVQQEPVIVVSGLPRSGTSMMMAMLEAGGLDLVVDGQRAADVDNPKGYYEFERVKRLDKGDRSWLGPARGRAVKVISALLEHIPPEYEYRVLFMTRDFDEVIASQAKMLHHRGEKTAELDDDEVKALLSQHVAQVLAMLANKPNCQLLKVYHRDVLAKPQEQAERIARFLNLPLDVESMAEVVNPNLYRNRKVH